MSNEMIERVALVLKANWNAKNWEAMAKTAIAAMREPKRIRVWVNKKHPEVVGVYRDMIDAALKED